MSASSRFFRKAISEEYPKRFFAKIKYWMEHHPIASNSFLCLNLWVAGDILAQYSEHKLLHGDDATLGEEKKLLLDGGGKGEEEEEKKSLGGKALAEIDYARTAKSASYGAFVTGPILAVWYPYLDKVCLKYNIAARYGIWGAPVAKVLADEFLMDPPCLVLFYGYMNMCEGGTMDTFKTKLKSEFLISWATSLAVWPVVLLGTFRFLPVYAQAPLINVCCIVWDGFLSHRNAVARYKEQKAKGSEEKELVGKPVELA
uniref:Uncharacterized protein n=1 Tax=Helicotheca tamesis TaxID=374047 RepID=A0A7S2HNX3_9STRA|mmetsp:Transcript_19566/g.26862  ORF Transcript_19566/g.26862 Transcript_19566/m.26862 type:complete len:258 (+) Transcript_19566:267-1040(+)|eukprot:CAMPEP_0185723650 /NCGR_PEP_ID=MMETSP1171-20130828/419_1 /TAXON_ID=374046 /ORGANISM="Helicotheca tamensis, Strain CCMP826" /LENGTH=257 /DNA_ID=CAMNT_0028391385 /DNA_START=254 /DNA_END=1027 /DNA_ORIENTATION=-